LLLKCVAARAVGAPDWREAPVILRLLDGKGRNVQMDTIADVSDALDVYIEMRVHPQPRRKQARHAPIEIIAA
jgi:hypothetical protein